MSSSGAKGALILIGLLPVWSCSSISKKSVTPSSVIIIEGEMHTDEYRPKRNARIGGAAQGQFFLGLEYYQADSSANVNKYMPYTTRVESRIYGLEGPVSVALMDLIYAYEACIYGDPRHELSNRILNALQDHPELRAAWQQRRWPFESRLSQRESEIVDQWDKVSSEKYLEKFGPRQLDEEDVRAHFRPLRELIYSFARINSSRIPVELRTCLAHLSGSCSYGRAQAQIMHLRNVDMAQNTALLWDRANRERKDLVIVIGKAHLPEFANLVSANLPDVKVVQ